MRTNFDNMISRFSKFKLSYEKIIHKKVNYYNYCMAIPKGKKYFAWFTYYNESNICLFLEVNKYNEILDILYYPLCFDNKLSLNTILYGTIVKCKNTLFFCIEDIYYYCDAFVNNLKFDKKIPLFNHLFENIKNISHSDIKFTMAVIDTKYDNLINQLIDCLYPLYCIKFITNSENLNFIIKENIIPKTLNFMVKPDIQNDIYLLYYNNHDTLTFYELADVPSYKISVMLNNLFRNIKENKNLDFLEESDSDDEFENINENKYIIKNELKMKCLFNKNTQKWYPIEVLDENAKICNIIK